MTQPGNQFSLVFYRDWGQLKEKSERERGYIVFHMKNIVLKYSTYELHVLYILALYYYNKIFLKCT